MSSQAIVACRDIMLSIHRYLEPRDFISMRRTCKSFHKLSKMKILWIYAVQDLYHRHGLQNYVAQFSLEKMSLADLERLALSPSRFLDWMRRGHSKFIPKFENFEVLRPPRFVAVEFEFAFMVPGGRFLVTTSRSRAYDDGGETAACLWDLGYGKKHRMKRRPVAHVIFPPDFRTTSIAATSSSRVVLCGVFEESVCFLHNDLPSHS
ncbi:hypothetical protein CC1G_15144 [Coprinopsis cinerea okayama7|uniref:F-box domain-containing protein n=1 Tax=Coprinopsis cinerea (strain Okayama-7 / 130 / ATCC MYA-4618 / FGSC 9003) TaxID=240176 RepID=D6RPP8_COPC7|nr:hypothetical protein CC1G_15144 [Coprinopsis cinerea okayama7\|eukprot:XP_002910505.1 hypothetical protein CC1G_15144 [Coprinopsis cinerea okayama7\